VESAQPFLSPLLPKQVELWTMKAISCTFVSLFILFFLICVVKHLFAKTIIQTMIIALACAQATDCCDWLQQGQMYRHCKQDGI
jgi:hypothetical protein